jgi:hypothetical protein
MFYIKKKYKKILIYTFKHNESFCIKNYTLKIKCLQPIHLVKDWKNRSNGGITREKIKKVIDF